MGIKSKVWTAKQKLFEKRPANDRYVASDVKKFYATPEVAREKLQDTPLVRSFLTPKDHLVHKWLHYFPIYERYLSPYVGSDFSMLEIGVSKGGSLDMWREYFGNRATIFGIDIDPACAERVTPPNQVRIGSQADGAFLESVVEEMGELDVVLDDGSHLPDHQRASFAHLYPLLKTGGLYIIEDTSTSYWASHGGGLERPGTAIEFAKTLIDDMHAWYHPFAERSGQGDRIGAIHFHDSIVAIEKTVVEQPMTVKVPGKKPT